MPSHADIARTFLIPGLVSLATGCTTPGSDFARLRAAEMVVAALEAPTRRPQASFLQDDPLLDGADGAAEAFRPAAENPQYPGRFFIGIRGGVNAGNGEPSNDIVTYGAFGRYRVRGPLIIGVALDHASFDFEEPAHQVDVEPTGVVDTTHDGTIVTAWGEYEFRLADDGLLYRLRPFAGAGVGLAFLSDESASGQTQGGGTFDIEVSGGTEIVPGALFGIRFDVTRNVILELGGRYDFHITSLEVRDEVTGSSAEVDDYNTFGAYVGLQVRLGQ